MRRQQPIGLTRDDYVILGGLVAGIAATDVALHYMGHNTYSKIWGHLVRDASYRWLAAATWGVLTTHLFLGRPRWWHLPARPYETQRNLR